MKKKALEIMQECQEAIRNSELTPAEFENIINKEWSD